MVDDRHYPDAAARGALPLTLPARQPASAEADEHSAGCFGYLRGVQDKALAVRFIFRSGDSLWLPYSWFGPWQFHRSTGLLLKFTGDTVILVAVLGSNLDAMVGGTVNLTDRGLQRHRITWLRELDEDELKKAGEGEPTIDQLLVASFDAPEKIREWVKLKAPAFLGGPVAGA
jgi:hypothetical protein